MITAPVYTRSDKRERERGSAGRGVAAAGQQMFTQGRDDAERK